MNMEMNLQSSQEHATTLMFAYTGLVVENYSIFRPEPYRKERVTARRF